MYFISIHFEWYYENTEIFQDSFELAKCWEVNAI